MTALASAVMPEYMGDTAEPVKRKRGRPPKANKLGDAFPTLTLQFQTSPTSGSPTAELNSSMTVKMGEPDTFTPLMKVLPTTHLAKRKRRRRSSNESPTRAKSDRGIPTPMSSVSSNRRLSYQLDTKAMDKMFSLTNQDMSLEMDTRVPYTTPPSWLQPSPQLDGFSGQDPKGQNEGLMQFVEDDGFTFKLVVNELGRAELSARELKAGEKEREEEEKRKSEEREKQEKQEDREKQEKQEKQGKQGKQEDREKPSEKEMGAFSGHIDLSDKGYAMAPSATENNDGEKHIVPQTPKGRDDFYSGFARNEESGLGLKLTPQFNAMMYSVMSLNSPQQGRELQLQLFLTHQEIMDSQARAPLDVSTIDTQNLLDTGVHDASEYLAHKDERDARYALKKILKFN